MSTLKWAILATVFWSATVAVGTTVAKGFGGFGAAAWVYLSGGIALGALVRKKQRFVLKEQIAFSGYGLLLYLALSLTNSRGTLAVSAANYQWPILAMLLTRGEKARPGKYLGAALCGTGLICTFIARDLAFDMTSIIPVTLALIAALSWGIYSAIPRNETPSNVGLYMINTGLVALAFCVISPAACAPTPPPVWVLIWLTCAPATAYLCWDRAMRGDTQSRCLASAIACACPILSLVWIHFLLGSDIPRGVLVGGVLIAAGALVMKRYAH